MEILSIKRLLFVFFALSVPTYYLYSNNYQLPNSSFESWPTTWEGEPQPESWHLSNVSQHGFNYKIGRRSTDAHSGRYSVECQSRKIGALNFEDVAPSWVTLGTPWSYVDNLFSPISTGTGGTDGGIAWTARPDTMALWVKRINSSEETMSLMYYSWKGTSSNNKYKSKGGDCVGTSHTDEESDICRTSDGNTCSSPSGNAVQISEGWLKTKTDYPEWSLVKIPIKYMSNDKPEKMNIILCVGNYPNKRKQVTYYENSILRVDDISLIYSSCVHEIRFDGYAYPKFDKDKYEYYYVVDGDNLPKITCYRSGRLLSGDEISINYTPKDQGATTITVKAEDGSSTTTYNVYFVSLMDSNPYVKSIKIDGAEIPGFNSYITDYELELPYGSSLPQIEVETANDRQSYEIEPFKIPGVLKIHTFAQNKDYNATYTINFKVKDFDDTTLKNIFINDKPIEDFAPNKTIYRVTVPEGTTGAQKITYESAYPDGMQTITVDSKDVTEISSITVYAPGARQVREYRIMYNIENPDAPDHKECEDPSENRLEQIMINGELIDDYDPDVVRYTIEYEKYGDHRVISCKRRCDESTVKIMDRPYDNSTSLMVTAKNGYVKTYTLRYVHNYSGEKNRLKSIVVNGVEVKDFKPDNFDYTVDVNITDTPVVEYVKNYDIQSVVLCTASNGEASLFVKSNQTGVDDVTYKLHFNRHSNINALKYIKVDGKEIDGFMPNKFKYIVNVNGVPSSVDAETLAPDGLVFKTLNENNHIRFETNSIGQASGVTYDVYLHYKNEGIPNGEFNEWTKCMHSEEKDTDKPVGWFVPADVESTFYNFDTKYLIEYGDGQVVLKTARNYWDLAGRFPGLMTLGDIKVDFYVASKTKVTISGGIPFHNTPDAIEMKYNPVSNNKGYIGIDDNCIHMDCYVTDDSGTKRYTIKDSDFNNTWKIKNIPITDKFKNPTMLNIIVNSAKYNSVHEFPYYANWFDAVGYDLCSKLIVDYIRFYYNSKIKTIKVNGEPALISGTEAVAIVDAESRETIIDIEGEVEDQMYDVEYGEYKDNVCHINIRSYAEDGTYTDYKLKVTRAKSDSVGVNGIMVDGKAIDGFDPEIHQYEYAMPAGVKFIPDVVVLGTYAKQTCKVETSTVKGGNTALTVTAISESGVKSESYKIIFTQTETDVADLKNIFVLGHELNFKSDSTYYYIKRNVHEDKIPVVSAEKYAVNQIVTSTIKGGESVYEISVKSASGSNEKLYRVEFSPVPSEVGTLDMIYCNGTPINGFNPNVNEYEVTLPYGTSADVAITYDLTPPETQTVTPNITVAEDSSHISVVLDVVSETGVLNEYRVEIAIAEDSEARLRDLKVFGRTVEGFDPDRSYYSTELEAYSDSSLIPLVKDVEYETISPNATVSLRQITRESISVTSVAASGNTINYVIKTSVRQSDNTDLEAIYYRDAIIDGFSPDVHDYTIKIPFGSSTVNEELITYTAMESGQSVMVVKGDSETEVSVEIQVVAQDGRHRDKYTIHFVPDGFDPTTVPSANDVCVTGSEEDGWSFTTKCENVSVMICTLGGAPELIAPVPVTDPNCEDICSPCAGGYKYNDGKKGVFIYSFIYSGSKKILSGKIKKN